MLSKKVLQRSIAFLQVFVFITFSVVFINPVKSKAADNFTDQQFFGVWNGSSWTISPKLNYSYDGGPIWERLQSHVKSANGNYKLAKEDLLEYFKDRTSPGSSSNSSTKRPYSLPITAEDPIPNSSTAYLAKSNILVGPGAPKYINTISVGGSEATYNVDVSQVVSENITSLKSVGFLLMGKDKQNDEITFYSSNLKDTDMLHSNDIKPQLSVVINGNTCTTIYPSKDTYIDGGSAAVHCKENILKVQDSGAPFDSTDHRSYLVFDLSSCMPKDFDQNTMTLKATLKLTGKNSSPATRNVMVLSTGDMAWSEENVYDQETKKLKTPARSWQNTHCGIYSWSGVSGGCDWNLPQYEDQEYLHLVSRFEFGIPMIQEYQKTGDETYISSLISMMVDFTKDKPASYPDRVLYDKNKKLQPRAIDVGFRSSSWIRMYPYLVKNMSSDDNTAILKFLYQQAAWLRQEDNFTSGSNWGVSESAGMFSIGVYFPEFINSSDWVNEAKLRLDDLWDVEFYKDFSYMESSTDYGVGTLLQYLVVKTIGDKNGVTFSSKFDRYMINGSKYIMNTSLPSGYNSMFGDSGYVNETSYIKKINEAYRDTTFYDPELLYFSSEGAFGTPPVYTSKSYPVGMMYNMRSDWSKNALFLQTNLTNTGHGHPDLLQAVVSAYGRPLLVDSGRYNYTGDEISHYCRETAVAHNVVIADGDKVAAVNGDKVEEKAMDKRTKSRKVSYWTSNSGADFFEGSHGGYTDITSTRSILFVKPNFWIVSDYILPKSGNHIFDQLWHFHPSANPTMDPKTKKVTTNYESGPNIQVVPADPGFLSNAEFNKINGGTFEKGYYSESINRAVENKFISYEKANARTTTFDTVLYPTQQGDNRNVTISRIATSPRVSTAIATSLKINLDNDKNGDIGYYYLSHENNPATIQRSFDIFNYKGKAAYIQTDNAGNLKNATIISGKTLTMKGSNLINTSGTIGDLSVEWQGSKLMLSSHTITKTSVASMGLSIYSPVAITDVILNGHSIPFTYNAKTNTVSSIGKGNFTSSSNITAAKELGANHMGTVSIEYDVTPLAAGIDAATYFTGSNIKPESTASYPMAVRMNTSNTFDVRNGSSFAALANVPYSPNTPYHIRLLANLSSKTYDVYVTPSGGSETKIADNYAFGTNAPAITDVGKLAIWDSMGDKLICSTQAVRQVYYPIADTYIVENSDKTKLDEADESIKRGTGTDLHVKYTSPIRRSYLKFDFGLPTEKTAGSVKLRLNLKAVSSSKSKNLTVYGISNEYWNETDLTYNDKLKNGSLKDDPIITTGTVTGVNNYVFIITDYIQDHAPDGRVSISLGVTGGATGDNCIFSSREDSLDLRPQLEVEVD